MALRLDAAGTIICQTSVTEQGQGAEAVTAQVVATALGVQLADIRVMSGDTDVTPYGGGTWASRAAGIGGEAAWQAGKQLRLNILEVAASILQTRAQALDIRDGRIVDADTLTERLTLAELARITYFRAGHPAARVPGRTDGGPALRAPQTIRSPSPTASRPVTWNSIPIPATIRLLGHWVVEDCGNDPEPPDWSTNRCAAASCKAWAPPCSSTAATTNEARC